MSDTRITVRGYHLDGYGHVNNARYLEFLEEARWARLGKGSELAWWQRRGLAFVIARITIDYRAPASLGDVLTVTVDLGELGTRSGTVTQHIVRDDGTRVAEAEVVFVVMDGTTGRPVPLDGEVGERLRALSR